jgi:hypothetical protein
VARPAADPAHGNRISLKTSASDYGRHIYQAGREQHITER